MEKKNFTLKTMLMGVLFFAASSYLTAQQTISGSFVSNGATRSYIGAVPDSAETPLRLVLLFCGVTENATQMALRGFNNFLGNNTMVVYPEPLNVNVGFDNSAGVDDFKMVEDLIAHIAMNYTVDLDDLCIGGFSNGGIFTYNLICDFNSPASARPYSFKSFAIVSGAMEAGQANTSDCPIANEVPAIVFHGSQDPVIAYGGGNVPPPVSMATAATETVVDFWAGQINGCSGSPTATALPDSVTETPFASSVELIEYTCTSSPATRLYRINGGRHAWPGGNANFDIAQSRNMDINASALIAEFFESGITISTSETPLDPDAVSVYPNPVKDLLSIETAYSVEQIELFNITGQRVYAATQPNYRISLGDLRPGIYLLKIKTDAGFDVKKIIKE